MDYDVGQVLYAVSHKEMQVIPLRVTERIVRQTLEGEIVTYVAQLPTGEVLSDLSKLGEDLHTSLDEVRDRMLFTITGVVDKIVDTAKEVAVSAYGEANVSGAPKQGRENKQDDNTEKSQITLPDGTIANIKMPASA
jgi:hypothetical protein